MIEKRKKGRQSRGKENKERNEYNTEINQW